MDANSTVFGEENQVKPQAALHYVMILYDKTSSPIVIARPRWPYEESRHQRSYLTFL